VILRIKHEASPMHGVMQPCTPASSKMHELEQLFRA